MTMGTRPFTLIEIVVAVALLGVSLASIVTMVSQTQSRVMKAEQRWAREHNLTNAAEWHLLAGADAPMPTEVLPAGFSADCRKEAVVDLPEMAANPVDGWFPARYTVTVTNASGQVIGSRRVVKLVPEDQL